ncbi:hypothetical protein [uncultured Pseudodesulfovibrio sp.]|uniref:hypothetical protein n=1 Tax=uncultured Pseudodesulfovibrio sp. TaxID=2035858 RepID=UPI0029C6534C|nr:hypothetical protein [uncultured Pseudodesulfovibrio sp.]
MKKSVLLVVVFSMALMLAACGAQKNELDVGHDLFMKGDCAGAAPYLDDTIAQPDSLMDLAYACFLKGRCAEKSGDITSAYEYFYASKVVAGYVVAHDTHVNLNTYGRSEFVQVKIPALLAKLEPDLGAEKVKAVTAKVDKALQSEYLKEVMDGGRH